MDYSATTTKLTALLELLRDIEAVLAPLVRSYRQHRNWKIPDLPQDEIAELISKHRELCGEASVLYGAVNKDLRVLLGGIPATITPGVGITVPLFEQALDPRYEAPRKLDAVRMAITKTQEAIGAAQRRSTERESPGHASSRRKVFLAHSCDDAEKDLVALFRELVETHGFDVITGARPEARSVSDKVKSRITGCDHAIALWTCAESHEHVKCEVSWWIRDETGFAHATLGASNLIVVLQNGVHYQQGIFGDHEYIPLDRESEGRAFVKLSSVLSVWRGVGVNSGAAPSAVQEANPDSTLSKFITDGSLVKVEARETSQPPAWGGAYRADLRIRNMANDPIKVYAKALRVKGVSEADYGPFFLRWDLESDSEVVIQPGSKHNLHVVRTDDRQVRFLGPETIFKPQTDYMPVKAPHPETPIEIEFRDVHTGRYAIADVRLRLDHQNKPSLVFVDWLDQPPG